ncbi:MAG TPA: response regulator [Clostridiales bacterium]|nr:response regulator [Clostridiales bacterium]HPV01613.1 response regulator [Clostridiales bacterium]
MDKISVMVVDDSYETRSNVKQLLSFSRNIRVTAEAASGEEAIVLAGEMRPDVILMDINMPGMDGIKATEEISMNMPETVVVIMSVQGETEYVRKAMTAGAREYLCKPFSGDELSETIVRAYENEMKRREKITPSSGKQQMRSRVITIFSTKGGVGKTTIASNLAVSMARTSKKRVALLDLDLQFGDVAIMLNVSVKNTISDLVKEFGQMDESLIDDYLVTHFSGVRVLPAPVKPEYADYITANHIEKIINILRESYNYIIIDTSASFHETVLTSLDMSDMILVVSTLDLPTIKNVKSGLDVMETLNYPREKIHVVLNKASEQFGIRYRDFEDVLHKQIWAYVPEDSQTVVTSVNKGFPFVMTRTETKVARAIIDMGNELMRELEGGAGKKSPLSKLFG